MAKESYHKRLSSVETQLSQADVDPSHMASIAPQKWTKDTSSGPGISPATMKSQPPRKRQLRLQVGKRVFPSGKRKQTINYCSNKNIILLVEIIRGPTRIPLHELDVNQKKESVRQVCYLSTDFMYLSLMLCTKI